MSNQLPFARYWRKLSFTTRLWLASGVLLLLIVLITLIGLFALFSVRRQAETAILTTSQSMQPLLGSDEAVQAARDAQVEDAVAQVTRTSQIASAALILAALTAMLFIVLVTWLLNKRMTRAEVEITQRIQAESQLRRQNEQLEVLHETAIGLISHLDLNGLLADILVRAGKLLGTEHSFVYLVGPNGAEIERKVGVGIYAESIGFRMKPGEGVTGRVWQTGSPLIVNDIGGWSGQSSSVNYDRISSLAGVPLISRSKVVGVLGMAYEANSDRQFEDSDLKLLGRFAQLASLALDNAQLYATAQEEKQRSNNLLNVVIPIGVALSAEQNFDRLLEKILLEAKSFCNSDGGTLYLRTETEKLKFVIVRNDSLDIAMGGTSGRPIDFPAIPLYDATTHEANHSNVAAHVALTGMSINIPNAYKAEGFNFSGTKAFDERSGYRSTSFLTIPLKNAHDRVLGVLQLINAQEPSTGQVIPFDPSLEQIVASLSSLATVALEAYIRERKLKQQIQQLRIEIDEVKRKQQVSEIIETDFFQDLQDKARRIRRRSRSRRYEKPE